MAEEIKKIDTTTDIPNIKLIPLEIKNKFYKEYFTSINNSSFQNEAGINTVIINSDNPRELLKSINVNITTEFTKFIENETNENPATYDRSTIYETEIKENNIFIRWSSGKYIEESK
jgi:hypothetical protein